MFKIFLKILSVFLGFFGLPVFAYWTVRFQVDEYFRAKLLTLPSYPSNVAMGVGAALCVLSLSFLVLSLVTKKKGVSS